MQTLVLLGPQRLAPTLVATFDALGLDGSIAAVTAGWQEREGEVEEMSTHLGRPVVNLLLHERGDRLFADDPVLAAAYRRRQDRLRQLQGIYRLRLSDTLRAARRLLAEEGDRWLLEPERRAAIQAVRSLDAHHLRRVGKVHDEFEREMRPRERASVARHRGEIAQRLADAAALAIAGGHVAVLLNRLRLFGVLELSAGRPVVAWSAGAMALGERVVLFHDRPPQGRGDAEVLESGLGLFDDLLPLPHARRRLRLHDRLRVALFARRFGPAACVAMEDGARLERRDDGWAGGPGTYRLTARGKLVALDEETG